MRYLILFGVSQAADLVSTAFSHAHGAMEMNPLGRFLMSGGFGAIVWAKVAVVVLAALCVVHATRFGLKHIRLTNRVLLIASIIGLVIAAFNAVSWI
jgi:heme exporter protein D